MCGRLHEAALLSILKQAASGTMLTGTSVALTIRINSFLRHLLQPVPAGAWRSSWPDMA